MLERAKIMYHHSDCRTRENNNHIFPGYLTLPHGLNDEVMWQFMAVGHTKFRPDKGFGAI